MSPEQIRKDTELWMAKLPQIGDFHRAMQHKYEQAATYPWLHNPPDPEFELPTGSDGPP